jgi:hypothetical protein
MPPPHELAGREPGRRAARRQAPAGDTAVRHNPGEDRMSRTTINALVAVCAGTFGVALYAGLILLPAWNAYARLWERLAATVLSLYVLAVLVGIGVAGALAVVYFWG